MDELIRAVLTELAKGSDKDVVKDISIVSNGVRRDATGKWFITWRHPDRYDPISILPPILVLYTYCPCKPNEGNVLDSILRRLSPRCSGYGHDKSRAILPYREYRQTHNGRGPTTFFFGDGVSGTSYPLSPPVLTHFPLRSLLRFLNFLVPDLSAAQHADVLFVKVTGIDDKDNLKRHCDKTGIPYIPFRDFRVAKTIVGQIVRGEKTKDAFLVKPVVAPN